MSTILLLLASLPTAWVLFGQTDTLDVYVCDNTPPVLSYTMLPPTRDGRLLCVQRPGHMGPVVYVDENGNRLDTVECPDNMRLNRIPGGLFLLDCPLEPEPDEQQELD